jgi:hypothetical protein
MKYFFHTFLFLFFSFSPIYAQSSQIGNVLFDIPAGWQQLEQGEFTVLVPPGASEERLLIIIFTKGTDITDDARATFETLLADALDASEALEQESDLEQLTNANGLAIFSKTLVVADSSDNQTTRLYLGYDAGSRLEVIVVAANDSALFDVYSEELRTFGSSINILSNAGARLETSRAANPLVAQPSHSAIALPPTEVTLQGLYYGNELRNQLNFATNTYEYRTINYYYLFSPDGYVYHGLPSAEWIEKFNANDIAAKDPSKLGYYSLSGNQMTFSFPDSEPYTRTLKRTSETLFLNNVRLDPIKPLPSEFTLNGSYYHQSLTNISTSSGVDAGGIEGSVSGQSTITFYPNGRFDSSSFVVSASSSTAANATTSQAQSGSGTYSFQNYRLLLSYDDGSQQVVSFFVNPQEALSATPELVFIEGVGWLRQE